MYVQVAVNDKSIDVIVRDNWQPCLTITKCRIVLVALVMVFISRYFPGYSFSLYLLVGESGALESWGMLKHLSLLNIGQSCRTMN